MKNTAARLTKGMIIATFTDVENGIEAIVAQIGASRFSVAIRDIDSGEFGDSITIYNNLDQAIAKAKEVERLASKAPAK